METNPLISFVVVTYNTRDLIVWCLDKLLPIAKECSSEIIVVDNGSSDGTEELLKANYPKIKLVVTKNNLGFGGGNNLGIKIATGEYVILLNSDAYIHSGSLVDAIQWMDAHPNAGLVGAKLIGEDGSWQPYARMFPSLLNDFLLLSGASSKYSESQFFGRPDRRWSQNDESPFQADWVTGAFSIIRKSILDKVGPFDERFYLYYEEVDLCRRIKQAGYTIWVLPTIVVTHLGGMTCKKSAKVEHYRLISNYLYYRKHHGYLMSYLSMLLEKSWLKARILKNRIFNNSTSERKINESLGIIKIIDHAWSSTRGGSVSPKKPW